MTDKPKWTPPAYTPARWADAIDILITCEEYFEQRADAEYFTDSPHPHPNEEMRLLVAIREVLDE